MGGKMIRRVLILIVAVFVFISGLKGFVTAADTISEYKAVPDAGTDRVEDVAKAAEAQEADSKKMEEERKAVEEAKKIVVARVNGEEINMFMLVRSMNRIAPKYIRDGVQGSDEINQMIRKEALNQLIFEALAVQEAINQGINPGADDIEKVIANVKENFVDEDGYREYLKNSTLTEDGLKRLIERSRRYELITAREVYGKAVIEEERLQAEYEKEKGSLILPDNFVIDDVFFINKRGDEETIRSKADSVLENIRAKNGDIWKLVPDGDFIVRKLSIKKERHPEIYRAISDMSVGDLSGVIQDRDGFHIVKVIVKETSRQLTFEEARRALEPRFLVSAQEQRRKEWEEQLIKKAEIEIVSGNL
jgi:foldase protein PrsA